MSKRSRNLRVHPFAGRIREPRVTVWMTRGHGNVSESYSNSYGATGFFAIGEPPIPTPSSVKAK